MIENGITPIKTNKNVLKLILQLKILFNFESFIYKYSYVSFIILPSRSWHRSKCLQRMAKNIALPKQLLIFIACLDA